MRNYQEFLDRKQNEYGNKFSDKFLDKRFIPHYESGNRVEVTWKEGFEDYSGYGARTEGRKARFTVGVSTGWFPCFLQIYSKRSMGGVSILSSAIESIKVI